METFLKTSRSIALSLVVLIALFGAAPAMAQPAPTLSGRVSCYSTDVPAPPLLEQTIVLIDITTPQAPRLKKDFRNGVLAAVSKPGQRVVILPFAGIAPGQTLVRELDEVLEAPITDEDLQNEYKIGPFKKSQACVRQRQQDIRKDVASKLDALLVASGQPLQKSEIVYALGQVISDFTSPTLPTRIMVWSDGLQNGSGMTFYHNKGVKKINAVDMLKQLEKSGQSRLAHAQAGYFRVQWWGLLATNADSPTSAYLDAQTLAQYQEFWTQALRGWQASRVDIGQTLNNPDFQLPTKVSVK